MPKGYVIAHSTVTDAEKWAAYVAKSKIALDKYEGKPIVRGGRYEIMEGNGHPRNVVIDLRISLCSGTLLSSTSLEPTAARSAG